MDHRFVASLQVQLAAVFIPAKSVVRAKVLQTNAVLAKKFTSSWLQTKLAYPVKTNQSPHLISDWTGLLVEIAYF